MKRVAYIDIVGDLNAGGTCKVYLGINLDTGYPVAVKELDKQLFKNEQVRALFIQEANRYLYLDHPNIVKLEDLLMLPHHDTGYLVMEYVEGKNLKEYVNNITGPMPFENAAMFVDEALKAIGFAHNEGFIHNDIKPSNIMLSDDMQVKVIDFGISIDANQSQAFKNLYTPFYASPEQTDPDQNVDLRTDIYSMGVTLFELVMGDPPFAGRNYSRTELIEAVRTQELPDIVSHQPFNLPHIPQMNRIIKKATAKDPDYRYQSCEEFRRDLANIFN